MQETFLNSIKSTVLRQDSDVRIFLFGSRSRMSSTNDSDWDILILMKKIVVTYEAERQITDALYDLQLETGQIINTLVYPEHEWDQKYKVTPFYNSIMRDVKEL